MSEIKKYPSWVCEDCYVKCEWSLRDERRPEFKNRDDGTDDMEGVLCEVCGNRADTEETVYLGYPCFKGFEQPERDWLDPIGDTE